MLTRAASLLGRRALPGQLAWAARSRCAAPPLGTGARLLSSALTEPAPAEAAPAEKAGAPRSALASGKYLWGITDDQIATLGENVRRAVSLENASSPERMKVDLHRALVHWQLRPGDTGSSAVQIATLTVRIDYLSRHLSQHNKDVHSKRAITMLVGQRNRMLQYLLRVDREMYRKISLALKLGPWKQLAKLTAANDAAADGA
ncbi:hypothetical protein T492DRAFT_967681 [Pavlovales sp. CCMP2436]|nr:hypothetical protein T492DRAFT_967681 [Pavlovales sp. CCMP2436]